MTEYKSWLAEKTSAYLYRALAQKEPAPREKELFGRLAEEAEKQAIIWEEKVRAQGKTVPKTLPLDMRTRVVALLIRWLKPKQIKAVLAAMKIRGLSIYIRALPHHSLPTSIDEVGQRHTTSGQGNNLRAAVFGANDGLVSNASLIFGMAGAVSAGASESHIVLLAGTAGLLAGAFSMASGEYVSVRSQREMFEYQIGLEKEELRLYPEEEAAELALIYHARGLEIKEAQMLATKLIADPERALDTLAREELGLNPSELGSPTQAAFFSFVSFASGALVPLLPFIFSSGRPALISAGALTGIALFLVGATLSLFIGKSALKGGLRMLLIGACAATATYTIGHLIG